MFFHSLSGNSVFKYSNSGRKLDFPVCLILPVATVTELGIVFACLPGQSIGDAGVFLIVAAVGMSYMNDLTCDGAHDQSLCCPRSK